LKVGEMLLQVFGFFSNTSILMWLTYIYIWLTEFVFVTKIIPNPKKMGDTFGDIFGILFQVQII